MAQCYYKNDDNPNLIRSINSGVCMGSGSAAGFFSCCFPWDQCLPDGLCYANSSSTYYTALCTDQTLQDSVCQKACDGRYRTDVNYNSTSNLWACCDEGDPTYSTSTNLTFKAEAPNSLRQQTMTIVDFIPTATGTATTTASRTATSSASSTSAISTSKPASTQDDSPSSHSLSTGAVAGISVGVATVAVVLLVGLVFWMVKRKASRQGENESQSWINGPSAAPPVHYGEMPVYNSIAEKQGTQVAEAPASYPGQWRAPDRYADPAELYESR